jgi:hypothetical protein
MQINKDIKKIIIIFFLKKIENNRKIRFNIFKKSNLIIIIFLISLFICINYALLSPFPIGWDKGKHFGRVLFTLKESTLIEQELGTYYKPFYFEGPNIIITILVSVTKYIQNIYKTSIFDDFNSIIQLSTIFNFFFAYIISLTTLNVFSISHYIYKNNNKAILSSIIVISILGFGISDTGSIGVCISFLSLGVFIVYLDTAIKMNLNKADWLFFFLIITSVIFTHIIGTVYMFLYFFTMILYLLLKKEHNIKFITNILYLIIISSFFSIMFLFLFNFDLLIGIINNIITRTTTNTIIEQMNPISYFTQNINVIQNIKYILIIPFMLTILTIYFERKKMNITIEILGFVSLLFIFIPILPFVKPEWYIVYPISIIAGSGLFHITTHPKIRDVFRNQFWIIIFIYLVIGTTLSINNTNIIGANRIPYYSFNVYKEAYDLSIWFNNKFPSSLTILFPESGPSSYFLSALCFHKILFAEPRFSDIPSYQELAKIYLNYPTNIGNFNFINVSSSERYNILNKYNISAIIETENIKTDINSLVQYYSEDILFNWFQVTPKYSAIILNTKLNSTIVQRKEILESPLTIDLPVGPQWVRINIKPTSLPNKGYLAFQIYNHNNIVKKFFIQLHDRSGNSTQQIVFTLLPGEKMYYINLSKIEDFLDLNNISKITLCFSWYGHEPNIDIIIKKIMLYFLE